MFRGFWGQTPSTRRCFEVEEMGYWNQPFHNWKLEAISQPPFARFGKWPMHANDLFSSYKALMLKKMASNVLYTLSPIPSRCIGIALLNNGNVLNFILQSDQNLFPFSCKQRPRMSIKTSQWPSSHVFFLVLEVSIKRSANFTCTSELETNGKMPHESKMRLSNQSKSYVAPSYLYESIHAVTRTHCHLQ